ncbi:MAG: lasso RiPP family leader peptide-containing protein [Acidimicrobiia bacterium]|nr:lasso RiPP family leader peptide-containing protein [Acidimicrobiia bacterium]MBT8216336.1 lasso RiPP family leader peptide-containing protein [Acidimicrobiia bacterium]NNF08994.1 lasso RiPP family leader peptide-containing protein [Acidimicrobiia bacterium]NNL71543.1 lasso RiPP family leader peptide-containing protein [Acidimicrobiia bacterium]
MTEYQAPAITAVGLVSEVTLDDGSQFDADQVIN